MPMNMSYCRFENTAIALQECLEALDQGEKLSLREKQFAKELMELCHEILEFEKLDIEDDEANL